MLPSLALTRASERPARCGHCLFNTLTLLQAWDYSFAMPPSFFASEPWSGSSRYAKIAEITNKTKAWKEVLRVKVQTHARTATWSAWAVVGRDKALRRQPSQALHTLGVQTRWLTANREALARVLARQRRCGVWLCGTARSPPTWSAFRAGPVG